MTIDYVENNTYKYAVVMLCYLNKQYYTLEEDRKEKDRRKNVILIYPKGRFAYSQKKKKVKGWVLIKKKRSILWYQNVHFFFPKRLVSYFLSFNPNMLILKS